MTNFRRVTLIVCLTVAVLVGTWIVALVAYGGLMRVGTTSTPVYNTNSIRMPYDKLLLVRSGDHVGAVKILRSASVGQFGNGAKYANWYVGDGSNDLTTAVVEHGIGVVFEKYIRTQTAPGQYSITDAGSQLDLKAGPLWLEWSLSNHVYARPHHNSAAASTVTSVEITATPWTDVSEIDLAAPELRWIGPTRAAGR